MAIAVIGGHHLDHAHLVVIPVAYDIIGRSRGTPARPCHGHARRRETPLEAKAKGHAAATGFESWRSVQRSSQRRMNKASSSPPRGAGIFEWHPGPRRWPKTFQRVRSSPIERKG